MFKKMINISKILLAVSMSSVIASYASVISHELLDDYYSDTFTVGGTISGLDADGLVLQNKGDNLSIDKNGSFIFETALVDGSAYHVTILSQPTDLSQKCSVSNSNGTVMGADITDVAVTCTTYCNVNMVSGDTEYFDAMHEACEILVVGPDFIAEDGASVSLSSGWDIEFLPGFAIERGATLNANVLGQSLCMTSRSPMPYGRHSCVDQICVVDRFCCDTEFDDICLDRVETVCGLVCE